MKHLLTTLVAALALSTSVAAQTTETPFIVPTLHSWKAAKQSVDINQVQSISLSDNSLNAASKLLKQALASVGKDVNANVEKKATAGSLRLEIVKNKKLGEEGYVLNIDAKKGISVQAQTPVGIIWGVQTISQMLEQGTTLACGSTTDVPEYKLRGFMIDCGRKMIPMDYLRTLVRCLSHYKMNCLQVHLNDNGFKKYFHNNWDETYAGFRLESELFPDLTSRDGYYTKQEFREFIKWAATLGVEIIPEIDAPAHALAFTHFRPEYANPEFGIDHLDLSHPGVVPFLDSLYSEYLGGPDPVFAGRRVHIGTDEYNNKKEETREQFRAFTQHYIQLIKNYKKQPVVWGSLTWSPGQTKVDVEGVLMDVWSNGFAQPDSMKQLGYQLVSIPDGWVYIVPAAGYYYDYLYRDMLYDKWTPANINGKQFEEHDPQIEGGMFAVWNDVNGNGITPYDIHHRTMPALQVIAQKCWSATASTMPYDQWNKQSLALNDEIGYTWGRLPEKEIHIPVLRTFNLISKLNEKMKGVTDIGYDYSVSFDIVMEKENQGAALFTSPNATFYISDPVTGRIGYIRDGKAYSFDYQLRVGQKANLRIEGTNKGTKLFVDGKLVQELGPDVTIAADNKPYNVMRTLAFPIERAGRFRSTVTNVVIKQK